jgi:hypothetical protein
LLNGENGRILIQGLIAAQASISDGLCVLCRHIDFEYVGYHESSEYSSNSYSVQREFPAVSNSSKNCLFCTKILSLITDWLCRSPTDQTKELDVSRSRIDVRLDTDWHTVARGEGCPEEKTHSDRLRINCAVPRLSVDSDNNETCFLTFFLQKYEEPPIPVWTYPYDDHRYWIGAGSQAPPYTGRKRPLAADLTLFKEWKQMCQQLHGDKCSQIFKGTPKILPRVIDVRRRCLVVANEDDKWVCLSYVWGKTNAIRLLKSNVQAFSTPGSLNIDVLPNIVEDALQIAKGLAEQYLWVDSLCIIQDDEEDKDEFISKMDSIYALATVVIVAATCIDANSYLPGVRPGSRHQKQDLFEIRNVTLMQSLDPVTGVKVDLRTGRAAAYLGETVWDTRAWTLQERFLASRSLVFTAEQIFWECEEAFWCEDSFREIPYISPDPNRTSLCGGELNLSWNSDITTFDHYYRVLLEEYSARALTFHSDGLNAFSGVIRAFERSMGLKFFWGMPTAFLESALAWGSRTHGMRRRSGFPVPDGSPKGKGQFPSWSWVGWTGGGHSKLNNQNLTTEPLGLEFYQVSDDGRTVQQLKQAVRFNHNVDLLAEGSSIPDRSSRTTYVSPANLPTDPSVSLSLVLCFWTGSTYVKIKRHSREGVASGGDYDPLGWEMTMTQGTNDIQVSWSQIPSLKRADEVVEVIAIAQNRGDWDNGHIENGAIGIMVISWEGGVAFRNGVAWIAIRDWVSLRDRRWKLIVLG